MKAFVLFCLLSASINVLGQNLFVDDSSPVGKNLGFYLESGDVSWLTSFNLVPSGSNKLSDLTNVQVSGRVTWSTGIDRNQKFEAVLTPVSQSPGLYEAILRSDDGARSVVFKKSPATDAKWEQISAIVSYSLNGIKYTLPEVVLLSQLAIDGTSTKIDLANRGIIIDKNNVMIEASVIGSQQSVRIKRVEITDVNPATSEAFTNEHTGLGPFKINLKLANAQPGSFRVKIASETTSTGAALPNVEKNISFFDQLRITSIDGVTEMSNGYRFDMLDKQNATFQITTNGVGELSVAPSSKNYTLNLIDQRNGIYQLSVSTTKIIFDDEERVDFFANGIKAPGDWLLFRRDPEPSISTEQVKSSGVNFQITFPKWVTNDVNIKIPKRSSSFEIKNIDADVNNDLKVFKLNLAKTDFFLLENSKDSVFNGKIEVLLASKKLITQEFKFLNIDYYLNKISQAQNIEKKNVRKQEINKVLVSLFESTGSQNEPLIKSIVNNLASDKESEKKQGVDQILAFVVKLAPILIALI